MGLFIETVGHGLVDWFFHCGEILGDVSPRLDRVRTDALDSLTSRRVCEAS